MKLLIAEDDLTSRTMLSAVTARWGFEVVTAGDGGMAWDILQQDEAPSLLLLDWEMPTLSGPALCQKICEKQPGDPPYIVLLTARSTTADIVKGLTAGANDFVAKPFDNAELRARLEVGRRMLEIQEKMHESQEMLSIKASHDALTGLLNRGAIMAALQEEIARAQRQCQPLCVALCDIDHFKRINDTHGHLAGDAVLKEISTRIARVLRPYDKVGRYGGEEFLILLDGDRDYASNPLRRISQAIADMPFDVGETKLGVTVSGGAVFFSPPGDKRDGNALIAAADTALYQAKSTGRNRMVVANTTLSVVRGQPDPVNLARVSR